MKVILFIVAALVCAPLLSQAGILMPFHTERHLLGAGKPKAGEFPEGSEGWELFLEFAGEANDGPATLEVRHRDVVTPLWKVVLNGADLGWLSVVKGEGVTYFELPKGTLRDGSNILQLRGVDRHRRGLIVAGPFLLHEEGLGKVPGLAMATVAVRDATTKEPVPARLTILDEGNKPAAIHGAGSLHTAVRAGVLYTMGKPTGFAVAPGKYRVFATRGMEWSCAAGELEVTEAGGARLDLKIAREVDTSGFIACDTHVHTREFSNHGDASVAERLVTLAGEGVELAIATDHNHNADYGPAEKETGITGYFTAVTGNEVSTNIGHINAFPLNPEDPVPDHKLSSWGELYAEIRAAGAEVVILNHPRWPFGAPESTPHGPFGQNRLSRTTGSFQPAKKLPFDALEVINSDTRNSKKDSVPLYVIEDWLALLNHGESITAVGSSDSHTVGNIVGQGRTYLRSATDNPAKLDLDAIYEAFNKGRSSISLGIFTDVRVDGEQVPGDVVEVAKSGEKIPVKVRVATPSWVTPRQVSLYLNGRMVMWRELSKTEGKPMDQWVEFSLARPAHDSHLVAVVLGDPVTEPFWKTTWDATLAATNPVYLDASGDGEYQSPRATAQALVDSKKGDLPGVLATLDDLDSAIGVQVVDLLLPERTEEETALIREKVRSLADDDALFMDYQKELAAADRKR